jgi:hypothetical protein
MGFSAEGHQSYGRPLDRYRFAEPIAQRAYFVRENVGLGSKADLTTPKSLWVDIVAKVFLGWRTKILRTADAFCARRREGPYRLIQNRSLASVVALKSNAAAEKSKDQLSRDF